MRCGIFGRQLDQRGDLLSIDCADGCWGRSGEVEAAMDDSASLSALTSNSSIELSWLRQDGARC
jgi:hypothetical protein